VPYGKVLFFLSEQVAIILLFFIFSLVFSVHLYLDLVKLIAIFAAWIAATLSVWFYFFELYELKTIFKDYKLYSRFLFALGLAILVGIGSFEIVANRNLLGDGNILMGISGAVLGSTMIRWFFPLLTRSIDHVYVFGEGKNAQEVVHLAMPWVARKTNFEVIEFDYNRPLSEKVVTGWCSPFKGTIVLVNDERESHSESGSVWKSLMQYRISGAQILEGIDFVERMARRIPISLLKIRHLVLSERWLKRGSVDEIGKRCADLALACLVLAFAAPFMILIAIMIFLDSKGPIFYRQERMGKQGKNFWITKFRTMHTEAESDGQPRWAQSNDPRITRIGKILREMRLDELPQLFSVIRGDMSFVGPRPERPYFVEKIEKEVPFYRLREVVKPGITGWAQLCYPYGSSIEDAKAKLEYDLYYIKNCSLFLDLLIFFNTFRHVLLRRGAR
jgi:exopolysaccharide biosynthesis polyprenyl glycosylphosphotransferase